MAAMNRPVRTMIRVTGAALALLSVAAVLRPAVFSQTGGGLWEVSRANGGRRNVCIADPALLSQYENLRANCARDIVRNTQAKAEIHYSCTGGAFGQSTVELITPRSLRIETQGISDNAPFHYVLQARRLGDC
jgi:hypothetical protein